MTRLTQAQVAYLARAARDAARHDLEIATILKGHAHQEPGTPAVIEQFDRQAKMGKALADMLDAYPVVQVLEE